MQVVSTCDHIGEPHNDIRVAKDPRQRHKQRHRIQILSTSTHRVWNRKPLQMGERNQQDIDDSGFEGRRPLDLALLVLVQGVLNHLIDQTGRLLNGLLVLNVLFILLHELFVL